MPAPDSVADRVAAVEARLAAACRRAGRDRSDVHLVAVSKRQPVGKIRQGIASGLRIFGENRVQEGTAKAEELSPEFPAHGAWHLIGPLQSNKVKQAVATFDVLHAVDRTKIARKVAEECRAQDREVKVFVQVNVGEEASKHGFSMDEVEDTVRSLAGLDGLRIVGWMAIPPWEEDLERARHWFRTLRQLRDRAASWPEWRDVPGYLSMGMSHDFEVAIEEGATHVRVGTDLFGPRDAP